MRKEEESQDLIAKVKKAAEETLREMDTLKKDKNFSEKDFDKMILTNKEARENTIKLFKEVKKLIINMIKKKILNNDKKSKELLEKIDEAEKKLEEVSH